MADLVLNFAADGPAAAPLPQKAKGGHWRDRLKQNHKRRQELTKVDPEPKRQKLDISSGMLPQARLSVLRDSQSFFLDFCLFHGDWRGSNGLTLSLDRVLQHLFTYATCLGISLSLFGYDYKNLRERFACSRPHVDSL
jgi:hypothetical protein